MKNIIYLSTVTPVFTGAKTLHELVYELDKFRQKLVATSSPLRLAESIFVDDGSVDGSEVVLKELSSKHDWIQVITLSRNYGQHPATMAGILHASGDWIATLDEDLQHHPKYLLDLLKLAILERKDVIYAHPESAVHESGFRDKASRGYKWLVAKLSGNQNITYFNSFRMMRANIARAAAAVATHQTYFDLALGWFTSRIDKIDLPLKDARYIKEGRSGYSVHSLMSHARRMIQSSEIKLLRIGAILGILAMLISIGMTLWALIVKLLFPEIVIAQGWASVIVAITFFGGLNAFLAGLVLENLSLVIMQTHGKPTFFEVDRRSDGLLNAWFNTASV